MITVDSKALVKDLQQFYLDTVRKLENMVRGFSYEIAMTAINNTPIGDAQEYRGLYLRRERAYGLRPIEGLAKGGWQITNDGSLGFQQFYGQDSGKQALDSSKGNMLDYKLGQTVLVGNFGPYIQLLENNYSPQTNNEGIMTPTLDSIMAVQRTELQRYYNQG